MIGGLGLCRQKQPPETIMGRRKRFLDRPNCKICDRPVGDSFKRGKLYFRDICQSCRLRRQRFLKNLKLLDGDRNPLKCSCCGWAGLCDIHHIDEDHTNNEPNNLQVLCPNCHRGIHSPALDVLVKLAGKVL